eukprot:2014633-Rhodomonas_salina.6
MKLGLSSPLCQVQVGRARRLSEPRLPRLVPSELSVSHHRLKPAAVSQFSVTRNMFKVEACSTVTQAQAELHRSPGWATLVSSLASRGNLRSRGHEE